MIITWHFLIGLFLCSILVPLAFKQKVGYVGLLVWSYFIANSIWTAYSPFYNPDFVHPVIIPMLKSAGQQSLILLLTVPIIAIIFTNKLLNIIKTLMFIDALLLLLNGYGVFNVGTLDAGVLAACLPLFLRNSKMSILDIMSTIVILASIIISKSATGALVLLCVVISYMTIWKSYVYALISAIAAFGVSFLIQGSELFNDSSRIICWKHYSQWWIDYAPKWTGLGVSTFSAIAPFIPNGNETIFLWLHNDWLQLLFDAGIIGFVLVSCLYITGLIKSRKDPVLFSSLIGFGVCSLTYSPIHFVLGQLIASYLIIKALRK